LQSAAALHAAPSARVPATALAVGATGAAVAAGGAGWAIAGGAARAGSATVTVVGAIGPGCSTGGLCGVGQQAAHDNTNGNDDDENENERRTIRGL
jgi:hypothetical protein